MNLESLNTHDPLEEYPWKNEILRLLRWANGRNRETVAFCFDVVMSLAYIDSTSGLEKFFQVCPSCPTGYRSHLGFINLCSPCFEKQKKWVYQKAAKPESGALGKLSSEITIFFIGNISKNIVEIKAVGGTECIDAIITMKNDEKILGEVKAAPLITYPLLNSIGKKTKRHNIIEMTNSQFKASNTALYMHNKNFIPLGKPNSELWPFDSAVNYLINNSNAKKVSEFINTWKIARVAYKERDKKNPFYYLANASGNPPNSESRQDKWPKSESISDSKTSAGMDRTDDIKKGIYQVLKIGTEFQHDKKIKTALISNLPAYRHGKEYIDPFVKMYWANEDDLVGTADKSIPENKLRRVFDYLITIEDPILRGIIL